MESQTNKGALSMNSTKQLVRAVKKCISKIWEDRKVIDPEEEPGFAYRNPTWEEELPPIHPVDHLNFDDDSPPRISLVAKDGCKKFVPYPTPTQPLLEDRALVRNRWKKAFEAIMKELALRKQATLSSVGIGAQIKGKSFGIWDEYNERRLAMFRIVFSQWNEYFLLIVTWIQCLVIIFKSMHKTSPAMFSLFTLHIVDAICTSIFTVDCSLRIFCLGLIVGQTSYLRSHRWNQLDFLSTIDSWCQLGVGQFKEHDPFFRFATFRIFRQLHSLHNFAFFDYVVAIMEAIQQSLRPLYDVFLLGSVFTSMYALFGTQFFGGDLRMRCSRLSDAQIGFPEKFCNRDKGFACPRNQHCMEGSNPNFGATQFDFYPLAFLTMFQIVSLEGWSLLMYMIEQSDYKATEAYFISLVLVCSYFLVNIVVAAISGTFLRIRMEHQVLLKKKYRPDKISFYDATILASALKDTIKRSDSNKLWLGSSLRRSLTYYFKLFRAKMIYCAKCFSWDHKMKLHFRGKVLHIPPYASAGSRILASPVSATWLKIVQSKYFKHFELFSVTANLLIQCLYADTMSTLMENMIHILIS